MCLVDLGVQNRSSRGVAFDTNAVVEARCTNEWTEMPNLGTAPGLAARGQRMSTNQITLLLPADADACRFVLNYHYFRRRLPLGIGDPWARTEVPSLGSRRVQQVTKRISLTIYNWLWPPFASPAPPHWRKLSAEVVFPQPIASLSPEDSAEPNRSNASQ